MAADFEDFSDHAQQVLEGAQDEANAQKSPEVTLRNLLAAVVRHPDGEAVLLALNVDMSLMQAYGQRNVLLTALNATKGLASDTESKPLLPLSDTVSAAIEFARAEAKLPDMKSDSIHVAHLLVGVIHAGDATMIRILEKRRLTVEGVRAYVSNATAKAMQAMATGAELRIWGTKEAITRLMLLSGRLGRPIDDIVWDAVERTWFTEREPAKNPPNP